MKKVSFNDLVVGKKYYTVCGIWRGTTTFVGSFQCGKRTKYRFTYGTSDNWQNQFGHFCTKSNIEVYEIEHLL